MCNRLVASVVIMPLRYGRTKLASNWPKLTGDVLEMDPDTVLQENKAVFPGHSSWFEMAGCVFFKRPALSRSPLLLLLICVISPSHHQRASKTAQRRTFHPEYRTRLQLYPTKTNRQIRYKTWKCLEMNPR